MTHWFTNDTPYVMFTTVNVVSTYHSTNLARYLCRCSVHDTLQSPNSSFNMLTWFSIGDSIVIICSSQNCLSSERFFQLSSLLRKGKHLSQIDQLRLNSALTSQNHKQVTQDPQPQPSHLQVFCLVFAFNTFPSSFDPIAFLFFLE